MRKTYREWPVRCDCGFTGGVWAWSHELPPACPACNAPTSLVESSGSTLMIATDDIPGGIEIKHGAGLINPDGSPRRYYSKTDLKRAANEHGWTIGGDTPKPYKIRWSGVRKSNAGLPPDK